MEGFLPFEVPVDPVLVEVHGAQPVVDGWGVHDEVLPGRREDRHHDLLGVEEVLLFVVLRLGCGLQNPSLHEVDVLVELSHRY